MRAELYESKAELAGGGGSHKKDLPRLNGDRNSKAAGGLGQGKLNVYGDTQQTKDLSEVRGPLPSCLPAFLPARLPAFLPSCPPARLPACLRCLGLRGCIRQAAAVVYPYNYSTGPS